MKALIAIFILMLLNFNLNAQKVVQKSPKQFTAAKIVDTAKVKGKYPRLTDSTYVITDGTVLPIFESVNHKYFIKRTSKKTGNEYTQYIQL